MDMRLASFIVAACAAAPVLAQRDADFFVAADGSDDWSGRLEAPNADRTDGPFATIDHARQAVEDLRIAEPDREAPVTVLIRAGTHVLDEPLRFLPEDSGTEASPTIYAAYPGESPTISGGVPVSGLEEGLDGRWRAHLPEVESQEWAFTQLFVNGQRRYRPRLPKDGYYYIAGETPPTEASEGKGYDRFRFRQGELRADWANLEDVEVLPFHQWAMARMRVAEVDEERRVVTFTGPTCNMAYWASLPMGNRFLIENVREALTEPGEWYLDRLTGELTYIPLPGESIDDVTVVAPRLSHLLELAGDAEVGLSVEHIVFRRLTFAHTNWVTPERGYSFPQAEAGMGGAIRAVAARDCAFESCAVTHLGEYGIELGEGCRRNRIEDCEITDMGAGGIKIGTQGYAQDEERVASHNTVRNCLIAQGGRMHPAAIGILILHSPYNVISRNDIHDFYYTGISVGWQWGYAPSHAHHNTIEHNRVHTIGQGVLSDMGGIYTLGPHEGTVIRHNIFHDIESFSYGGWGIYFDQATTAILAENNLVYRTKTGGFHQHFGKENIVRNNIFAFAREGQLQRTRVEEHLSFTFERNIVYWTEGPLLHGNWSGDQFGLDNNLYWHAAGGEVTFAGKDLDEWRATGQDVNSIVENPLFVAPEEDDFSLRPGSPAEKIGFVPFDTADVGRPAAATRRELAPAPRAFPPPPEAAPVMALEEDFELSPVGAKVAGFTTYEDDDIKEAVARVTDETANSGTRCLKFVDLPGQEQSFNPHIFHSTYISQGAIEGSFALRMDENGALSHEWRTGGHPYVAGPSLRVGADGILRAAGQDLTSLPQGEWAAITITCGVGNDADGTWNLTVRLPGEDVREWPDLPCDAQFTHLNWFGFVAEGVDPGVFYLDDIELAPRDDG